MATSAIDPQVVTLVTTEFFMLQGVRAANISEGIGRATLYIGAVSSVLVALGFLGQEPKLREAFFASRLSPSDHLPARDLSQPAWWPPRCP